MPFVYTGARRSFAGKSHLRLRRILFISILLITFCTSGWAQCVATVTPANSNPCYGIADTLYANSVAGNSYQWLFSANAAGPYTNISGATLAKYITTLAGYYKVNIINGTCSVTSSAYHLTFDVPQTATVALTGADTICPGQSVIISANSGNQITYQWQRNNNNMAGFTGTAITIAASGSYSVVETDQFGCSTSSSAITITQRVAPTPQTSPSSQAIICDSPTALITTTAYSGATYTWSQLAGNVYNPIPGATGNSYTASSSGTYEVTAFYNNGCLATSLPVSLTFSTTPAQPAITSNSPVCLGSTIAFQVTNGISGYTYIWSGPGGFTSTVKNATKAMASPSDSGFYTLQVTNNGCSNIDSIHIAVTCLDSVWPGDVNTDHVVDNNDALYIALGWGYPGYPRSVVSDTFNAYFCRNWGSNLLPGIDLKHADCNGNGTIDTNDIVAISANYGHVHAKSIQLNAAKNTNLPDLYFDLTSYPYLYPGQVVSIPIRLGAPNIPISNIMGIAADVTVSGLQLTTPPTITYPQSWLGSSTNTIRFAQPNYSANANINTLGWAYVRTDHINISGYGTLANFNFTVPTGIGINSWAFLNLDNVTIIDNNGTTITAYNVVNDTTIANPTVISNIEASRSFASIRPNPSIPGIQTYLEADLPAFATIYISIADITGKPVWQYVISGQGKQNIPLPAYLNEGMYFIHLQRSNDNFIEVLKWLKD